MRGAVAQVLRRAAAVAVADASRFLRHVEGFDQLARGQHVERPVVERVGRDRVGPAAVLRNGVELCQQRLAVAELVGRDGAGSSCTASSSPSTFDRRRRRGRDRPGRASCTACAASSGTDRRTPASPGRSGPASAATTLPKCGLLLALGRVHRRSRSCSAS